MAQLPLALRKNLRDNEAKRDENLAKIAKVTGVGPWVFECDFGAVNSNPGLSSGYKDRLGEILYANYLPELAGRLEKILKDDMVKEAFLEKATAKKIIYRQNDATKNYHQCVFENGALIIQSKPEHLWTNISQLGEDIEKNL